MVWNDKRANVGLSKIVEVRVKTNSKKELVKKIDDQTFEMKITTPPIEGKANKKIIELLAKDLKIPKSKILLYKGEKSKTKLFKIE